MTFAERASYFEKLEKTPSRIEMTKILAELFRQAGKEEIGEICYLIQGRVAPLYAAIEFGIADKLLIRAIALASGHTEKEVVTEFKREGDLGVTAQNFKLRNQNLKFKKASVVTVFKELEKIARSEGEGSQEKKIQILADLISTLEPLSVRYVVRIPLDKLRLGFRI